MSAFTVISFFTPDWHYPEYAQNLAADCKRLGLDHVIEQKLSTDSYVGNCNIKPFFIREKIQELKQPVLWIDVDGSILKIPSELEVLSDADIMAYTNQRFPDRISVNVLLFSYTPNTLTFLDTWCEYVIKSIDDGAFNDTVKKYRDAIKIQILPAEQTAIVSTKDKNISFEICFANRLSGSDLKWQYKNKVEGRR